MTLRVYHCTPYTHLCLWAHLVMCVFFCILLNSFCAVRVVTKEIRQFVLTFLWFPHASCDLH
jgi:hypothetical protein